MKLLVLIATFVATLGTALGCLWDTDTLAMEAKGLPDVVNVISGRFERNPPLYYEMRLKRVTGELKTKPGDLALYDDAAVSASRLNRNDEAIEWMEKKLKVLEVASKRGEKNSEHWYRYHANLGTFLIHKWLHDGAQETKIADAIASRDEIATAIEINPDAHFGREYMQLAAINGIIDVKTGKSKEFSLHLEGSNRSVEQEIEGICGLIVLGAAWESVDIFDALTRALSSSKNASIAYLAVLRRNELLDQGFKPLEGTADKMRSNHTESRGWMVYDSAKHDIVESFNMLRKEAKAYENERMAYMMARLETGRHPDTDPTFWSQWKEPPAPVLRDWKSVTDYPYGPVGIAIAVWMILMAWAIRQRAKKRRLMASTGS